MNKYKKLTFILIIVLAFALRFYKLGQIPTSLDWDENSNAYNAYSILKTGRDEYGNFLPLTNRSFDDYKPPLYMYLNVMTIPIFGLTPFASRLPSAFLGTATVILAYYLAKFLFRNQKIINVELASQISMLLLATSPWHAHFSRVGFEANVGLFCAVSAITTFLYGLKKRKLLPLSALLFAISAYSYHSVRIYLPLLFLATIYVYRNEIKTLSKKIILSFLIIASIFTLPVLVFTPRDAITERFNAATSELRREEAEKAIKYIKQDQKEHIPFASIIDNRRLFTFSTILDNYLWHFDLNYLFIKGDDNFRHHIEGQGMLYLWQLPFILMGIFQLIKNRSRETTLILLWLLIAPIAAAPARPAPHAIRSEAMVIPFILITAFTICQLVAKKGMIAKMLLASTILAASFSFIVYLHDYFIHYPLEQSAPWQYGYNTAAEETDKLKTHYEKIKVDGALEQAYIFWLFSTKFDPSVYQKNGSRNGFDKYVFNSPAPTSPSELYVSTAGKFPENFIILKTINYPNGEAAIKIGYPQTNK
ncbi:glycosyltransferase family 39 protein [Candidatus Curtissbacteria bacterium]|nr:glycosyltransferase family 39 protein [Candidatus Curtissbacteria bacterium]